MHDIIGTAAAARMLKRSQNYVKRLAAAKRIPATKIGKLWLFKKADVLAFKPASVGRPAK